MSELSKEDKLLVLKKAKDTVESDYQGIPFMCLIIKNILFKILRKKEIFIDMFSPSEKTVKLYIPEFIKPNHKDIGDSLVWWMDSNKEKLDKSSTEYKKYIQSHKNKRIRYLESLIKKIEKYPDEND